MLVTITLLLYAGIAATVYYFLLLFALIIEPQVNVSWVKTPFLALRALLFLDTTRKIRSCVFRLWLSILVLVAASTTLIAFHYSLFD
jgi:hypothetical protein